MSVSSLDGISRIFVVVSSFSQFFVALLEHQFVWRGLGRSISFNRWLGSDDYRFAVILHNALKPNIVVENLILKQETVEVFRGGCAVGQGTEGYAITFVLLKPCRFQITLGATLEENFMLPLARKPADDAH